MIEHIRKNKKFLRIFRIAEASGVPTSTLQKAVEGIRKLSNSQELKVEKVLKEMRYDKN